MLVDIIVAPAALMLCQKPGISKRVEIFRCGLTGNVQIVLNELYPRIGMSEHIVEQVLRIKLREVVPEPLFDIRHLLTNAPDEIERRPGGFIHRLQHVNKPAFPLTRFADLLQKTIIFGFRVVDGAAEIEDWRIEQPHSRQVQNI